MNMIQQSLSLSLCIHIYIYIFMVHRQSELRGSFSSRTDIFSTFLRCGLPTCVRGWLNTVEIVLFMSCAY